MTMLSVEQVAEILESRGVSAGAFWRHAAGGDQTPILAEDLDRLISECEGDADEAKAQA